MKVISVKKKESCVLLYCLLVVSTIYAADWQANWIGISQDCQPNSWYCFRQQARAWLQNVLKEEKRN